MTLFIKLIVVSVVILAVSAQATDHIWIDNSFIDISTGLSWQDDEKAITVKKDWQGAKDYCENLTLSRKRIWRLPTSDELLSLLAKKQYLRNMILENYWSSSSFDNESNFARIVHFHLGGFASTKDNELYVRCVRNSNLW
ncbi:MAG: DUF1566 domain-containing protein [Sulfuricurvum sp.]|jgi:hypothetical protein